MKETTEIKMFANGKWKMGMTSAWRNGMKRRTVADEETRE